MNILIIYLIGIICIPLIRILIYRCFPHLSEITGLNVETHEFLSTNVFFGIFWPIYLIGLCLIIIISILAYMFIAFDALLKNLKK